MNSVRINTSTLTLLVLFLFVAAVQTDFANGEDWPRWRGAEHNDKSTETDLLESWPDGGPPQAWVNSECGLGYAGVSVVGEHLYTMGLFGEEEIGLCLNTESGEIQWKLKLGDRFGNGWGDGPRSTPTVDENGVYFMSANGNLVCAKRDSGEQVWAVSMSDFGGSVPQWGYAESPLVDDKRVVCTPGGEQGMVVALDKMTGEKLWQSASFEQTNRRGQKEPAGAHYSSVTPAMINGSKQYIQLTVACLVGLNPEDGSTLWEVEWPGRIAVIPSPVILGDDNIYATTGYNIGGMRVALEDGVETEELWRNQVMKNKHGGVVVHEGHIYGHSEGTGFVCQDLENGEMKWNERMQMGAIAWADGLFYYVEEGSGNVLLMKLSPERAETVSQFQLSPQSDQRVPQGRIWMHPVIANGKLYLRDQEHLVCYDIREKG